jgi:hypothetical protein
MAKKTTLDDLAVMLTKQGKEVHELTQSVEHVVSAVGNIEEKMGTKDQLIALHTQVNSIERQLRGMRHVKLEDRVAAIEEEVFGEAHA